MKFIQYCCDYDVVLNEFCTFCDQKNKYSQAKWTGIIFVVTEFTYIHGINIQTKLTITQKWITHHTLRTHIYTTWQSVRSRVLAWNGPCTTSVSEESQEWISKIDALGFVPSELFIQCESNQGNWQYRGGLLKSFRVAEA